MSAGEAMDRLVKQFQNGEIMEGDFLSGVAKDVTEPVKKALAESMKPAGFFNIPELLEGRRLEYGIPNGAFFKQATGSYIYVWQIPEMGESGNIGSTRFIKPDATLRNERQRSCRGVLVSAGLLAMEQLASNDVHLGDIIQILQHAPWRMKVDEVSGIDMHVHVCQAGNVTGCEGTAFRLHTRAIDLTNTKEGFESPEYRYVTPDGKCTPPPETLTGGESNWLK